MKTVDAVREIMKAQDVGVNKMANRLNKSSRLISERLSQENISINKLMRDTNTDFKVLKRLMTGELVRFDIFVVARLCDYFNCEIEDIIEYRRKA